MESNAPSNSTGSKVFLALNTILQIVSTFIGSSVPTNGQLSGTPMPGHVGRHSQMSPSEVSGVIVKNQTGALLSIEVQSSIGVLLDDYPSSMRDRVAIYYVTLDDDRFWTQVAHLQLKMTEYRQVFRSAFYPGKKQLTLAPEDVWQVSFITDPQRRFIDGHDYVIRDYVMRCILIGRNDTLEESEPSLVPMGGVFSDTWALPVDPEFLLQRTGYACMDEASFPRGSVFSGNTWVYYDDTCGPEAPMELVDPFLQRCHWTQFPNETCKQALVDKVGHVTATITWRHLEWDDGIADRWRVGDQKGTGADLASYGPNLEDDVSLLYRFFANDSCALMDSAQCVKRPGWRRLLRFTSTAINVGSIDLEAGNATDEEFNNLTGMFVFDPCHRHYHFTHYNEVNFGTSVGRKTGFCLQSTWRYHNNERVPFTSPYDTCILQGISMGWGDDYVSGLDCMWVDVTEEAPGVGSLTELLNPDGFLCEGTPILDSNGKPILVKTNFTQSNGRPVYRTACNFTAGYAGNNLESAQIYLPPRESMVTLPCNRHQSGPLRDCGFTVLYQLAECAPLGAVTSRRVHLAPGSTAPVVVRVCESSRALQVSSQCEWQYALANVVVEPGLDGADLNFTCPIGRDATVETGGAYSVLVAPLFAPDELSPVLM